MTGVPTCCTGEDSSTCCPVPAPRIAPPCHPDARLEVELATEGRAYMQYEVADGFSCSALGCYNTWDRDGEPT